MDSIRRRVKSKGFKEDNIFFESPEDYLNVFIELLVKEAQEIDYSSKKLTKLCTKRINKIMEN